MLETQHRPASGGAGLTVRSALALAPLDRGRVVAGAPALTERLVRWVAVIEGPVEDFVAPGELVLTSGIGCDEPEFERLAADVADAGAAALCVGVGPGAPLARVPAPVIALAERRGFPVVELPWEVRFADVMRAVVDRLLAARYATAPAHAAQLPSGLTAALLRRDGLASVAGAVEEMLDRPVLILDSAFVPLAAGALAGRRLGDLDRVRERAAAMDGDARRGLRAQLESDDVVALPSLGALGLDAALVATASAQERVLGYVVALGEGREESALSVERQALAHAGVAAAIECLRRQAAAEAESRVRGDFLWELAAGELSRQELTTKATLLGYPLHLEYRVLVAQAETQTGAEPGSAATLHQLASEVGRRVGADGAQATHRGELALVLLALGTNAATRPAELARQVSAALAEPVSWGIAETPVALGELPSGLWHARRALAVGRSLHGPGTIADAAELAPFLALAGIAGDRDAQQMAQRLLAPLVDYDAQTSRNLVHTLEVFLAENGNSSSAARRLFLNRHSLIHRLRRIEELTGRDLANHEDRFVLELSLRLRRLAAD